MEGWGGIEVARTRRNIMSYLHCLPCSFYERCLFLRYYTISILNSFKKNEFQGRKWLFYVWSSLKSKLHERCEFWGYRSSRWKLYRLLGCYTMSSSSSVICQTTGPKPLPKRFLHIVRSRASSFNWQYPLLSLRSSTGFLAFFLVLLSLLSVPLSFLQ